jgi:hypothetical protein
LGALETLREIVALAHLRRRKDWRHTLEEGLWGGQMSRMGVVEAGCHVDKGWKMEARVL